MRVSKERLSQMVAAGEMWCGTDEVPEMAAEILNQRETLGNYRLMLALADAEVPLGFRPDLESQPTIRSCEFICRLRLAFEGFIRDRYHNVEIPDSEVQDIIEEWLATAEDVEDVA